MERDSPDHRVNFPRSLPGSTLVGVAPSTNLSVETCRVRPTYGVSTLLLLQCIANAGVCGSKRSQVRVVQAGLLDMAGRAMVAWLASKGFAVGPLDGR